MENLSRCCEDLTSRAETDQQLVTEEMDLVIARYENLKVTVNESAEKHRLYQEGVEKYYEIDSNFGKWMETLEKNVAEFQPIILEEDFLEKNLQEAKVNY